MRYIILMLLVACGERITPGLFYKAENLCLHNDGMEYIHLEQGINSVRCRNGATFRLDK